MLQHQIDDTSANHSLTVIINALFALYLQNFYLWKKDKKALKDIKDKDKELLIQVKHALTHKYKPWVKYLL